jgi:predicted transcriptional regulator
MASRQTPNVARDRRRQEVARLSLRGWVQVEIAQHLGVTQGTVSNDLKAIRQQWRQSAVRDFDLAREEMLRSIETIKREAWDAWERSKKPQQEATVEGEAPRQKTRKRIRNQNGDPRYLEIILRCGADQRAILGLDAPTKIAPTTPDGKPLSFEQRQIHINAILAEQYGLAGIHDGNEERILDDA